MPVKLREFGILVTVRYWDRDSIRGTRTSRKHVQRAFRTTSFATLAAGKKPQFKADDERVFYDFTMEALENHFVSRKTFDEAEKKNFSVCRAWSI